MSEKKHTIEEMLKAMTPVNEGIIKALLYNNIDYIEGAIKKTQNDLLKRQDESIA